MDYVRRHGYEVAEVFKGNISGNVNPLKRYAFNQLLDFVRDRGIDVIVIYDLTKLYRPPLGQVAKALELPRKIMDKYKQV